MSSIGNSSLLGKIAVIVVILCCSISAHGKYGGGTGEPNDPYLIYDANQMNAIGADANDFDKCFKLMADIDLSIYAQDSFNIIGYFEDYYNFAPFTGVFDGNGHTISNFTYSSTATNYTGLFGYVRGNFDNVREIKIKNLGLVNVNIDGGTGWSVGGLVGLNDYGTIKNCFVSGNISGNNNVGGLVGANYGIIENSYAISDVNGVTRVGGFSGYNSNTVLNCYCSGTVSGSSETGGFIGYGSGSVYLCYWNEETSGQNESVGGRGKTNAEMKDIDTYRGWGNGAAWTIDDGNDYPRLAWENAVGELIVNAPRSYSGGTGEPNDPYQISTAADLATIGWYRSDFDKHFILTGDIDLTGYDSNNLNPIGSDFYVSPFRGSFDGNDHSISNFNYTARNSFIGLFGVVDYDGSISELGLEDFDITGGDNSKYIGCLAGYNSGSITNCYAIGLVQGGDDSSYLGGLLGRNSGITSKSYASVHVSGGSRTDNLGGLAGENEGGDISNCYASGNVTGYRGLGGLVGRIGYGTEVSNCSAIGDVKGVSQVGGLAGSNHGIITSCNADGTVEGNNKIGGLTGENGNGTVLNSYAGGSTTGNIDVGGLTGYNDTCSKILSCYSYGYVSGSSDTGGLIGTNLGEVTISYWDVDTSTQSDSDGGEGKTTGDMKKAATFVGWGVCNEITWTIDEDADYPRHAWEGMAGDVLVNPFPLQGAGDPNNPYLIYTAEELNLIGLYPCHWDRHFKLMADIDMSVYDGLDGRPKFNQIAPHTDKNNNWSFEGTAFTGIFDGNGHVISNITLTSRCGTYIGLFGYIGDPYSEAVGEVMNLGLINSEVDARWDSEIGLLAGYLNKGTIRNCYAIDSNSTGWNGVGGLVGWNNTGIIINCYFTGSVTGQTHVGGLCGGNNGHISNCFTDVIVTGNSSVGGLAGSNRWGDIPPDILVAGTITNCYSTGTVRGLPNVGGLLGENWANVIMSYSECNVIGENSVGGLLGMNGIMFVSNCYATGDVNGIDAVGGLVGRNAVLYGSGGTVMSSYSTGGVAGISNEGGLIGINEPGSFVDNSFWDVNTSGLETSSKGEGKTTVEMQDPDTFIDAGWDFERPIWMICGQDYPRLIWYYPDVDESGIVDFADYSQIADNWLTTDCGMCDGLDLTGDRDIDDWDLLVFTDNWLDEDEISRHLFAVEIYMGWDYENPIDSNDTEYEFELWMGTDDSVERVEFLTASGNTFEIPQIPWQMFDVNGGQIETEWEYEVEDNVYGWMYYAAFDEPNGLDIYGDGEYTITVHYDNGRQHQTSVWLGIPDTNESIDQPTQEPVPVHPLPEANVTSPVTFEWEPCTDSNVTGIWFEAENDATGEDVESEEPLPREAINWGPAYLSEGPWIADIAFGTWYETTNNDGIHVFIIKYSVIDYEFTVVP